MSTSLKRATEKTSTTDADDPLSALPGDIAALVERYGSARAEVARRIEHGSAESVTRAWEDVRRAEKRLIEAFSLRLVAIIPSNYRCGNCGTGGCKLWREYQTVRPGLLCGACALADQAEAGPIDDNGHRPTDSGWTDQIGLYVPAVPREGDDGFWAHMSVPEAGIRWWRALPTVKA